MSERTESASLGHAVVIGGSIAGLVAARVLTRHFTRVTVIDRDEIPPEAAPRSGAPQAHHAHVLLLRGRRILERLCPGIVEDIERRGGHLIDMAGDMLWVTPAGPGVRYPSDLAMIVSSRWLLEAVLREHVRADGRTTVLDRCDMIGLHLDGSGRAIDGVRVRRGAGAAEECITANFVVDASGRGSKMPRWLQDVGYPAPEETVVSAHLGYASRLLRMPEGVRRSWRGAFIQAAPPEHPRFGALMPIEDGKWIVSLGGGDDDHPPADDEGFLAFARGMRDSAIYDAIKDATPLTPIATSYSTSNRLRAFDKLPRFPERLAVLGDAACAFNPVYAQGMTVAALGADALDRCFLESCTTGVTAGLGRRFQRELVRVNATPWMLATGEDVRYRKTEGASAGFGDRLMHRYMDRVVELTTHDARVRDILLHAFHLMTPMTTVFRPLVVGRVFLGRRGPRVAPRSVEVAASDGSGYRAGPQYAVDRPGTPLSPTSR